MFGCFPIRCVAVTGTNGKTTTTALLGAILESGRWRSRSQATSAARSRRSSARLARGVDRLRAVLVSARGRRDARTSRRGADEPELDDLDRHGTFAAYEAMKLPCSSVSPRSDVGGRAARLRAGSGRAGASSSAPTTRCRRSHASGVAQPRERRRRDGRGARVGVSDASIAAALRRSRCRAPHRGSRDVDGVLYVNDSKATNAAAALRALASFAGRRKHVILVVAARPSRTSRSRPRSSQLTARTSSARRQAPWRARWSPPASISCALTRYNAP